MITKRLANFLTKKCDNIVFIVLLLNCEWINRVWGFFFGVILEGIAANGVGGYKKLIFMFVCIMLICNETVVYCL